MAKKYYSTLTKIGLNAIARATTMNEKVKFSKFCLGDAEINPDVNTTALGHEVWQGSISSIVVDENNTNWIVLTCIISATVGGFTIREVGIKDEDGNLLAVASYPETYKPILAEGAGKDLIVRVILEVSNTECVELKIDPTVTLATRSDLEAIEKKKADKEEVKKLEEKVETVEQTVENSIGNLDIAEKQIALSDSVSVELPNGNETLKIILSKLKKFLQKLHVEAGTYAKTNTTNTFDGVQIFNSTIRSTTSDSSLEVRTIQGPTSNGQDGNLYLNVYDPSKTVHFTTPDGVYHTLQELFQSAANGKSALISVINEQLGHASGLTMHSTFADCMFILKNEVIDKMKKQNTLAFIFNNQNAIKNGNFDNYFNNIQKVQLLPAQIPYVFKTAEPIIVVTIKAHWHSSTWKSGIDVNAKIEGEAVAFKPLKTSRQTEIGFFAFTKQSKIEAGIDDSAFNCSTGLIIDNSLRKQIKIQLSEITDYYDSYIEIITGSIKE